MGRVLFVFGESIEGVGAALNIDPALRLSPPCTRGALPKTLLSGDMGA
jgi:hypothetical protein